MAVKHFFSFGGDQAQTVDGRDEAGFKRLARPGYRSGDKLLLQRDSGQVEKWLAPVSDKLGLDFVLAYIEPHPEAREDSPEDWHHYCRHCEATCTNILGDHSPHRTLVYIKPTSRVHPLTAWQQLHNIGHATWEYNPALKSEMLESLRLSVSAGLQWDHDVSKELPTDDEVVVVLARLLDNLCLQRALLVGPGDLDDYTKVANTGWNTIGEVLNDLVASYLRNGANVPLRPRGPGKLYKADRAGDMTPNSEVVAKKQVRPWAWKKINAGQGYWDAVAGSLNWYIEKALGNMTWSKQNGPVYPYRRLTTLP
jgi:hypothetical protein